jgi:parallel beta-helix repeat protein
MGDNLKYYDRSKRLLVFIICFSVILSSFGTILVLTMTSPRANAEKTMEKLPGGVIPEEISTYMQLTKDNGPYYIEYNVTIASPGSLIIENGTEIYVNGSYYIFVEGWLNITGKSDDNALITSNVSNGKAPGDWGGIQFNATGKGTIEFCDIEYPSNAIAVYSKNNITISSNTITNVNNTGIYVKNTNVTISKNIINLTKNDGVVLNTTTNAVISENTISNITNNGIELINCINSDITKNTIENTTTGIHFDHGSNNQVENCVIFNSTNGIIFDSSNSNTVKNCEIHNTTFGIDIEASKRLDINEVDLFDNVWGINIWDSTNWNQFSDIQAYRNSFFGMFIFNTSQLNITSSHFMQNDKVAVLFMIIPISVFNS